MNKQKIKSQMWLALKQLAELDALGPVVLSAGGALVMHGLRDETEDLDLEVTQEVWDELTQGHGYAVNASKGVDIIHLCKGVDLHLYDESHGNDILIIEGILCQDLFAVLALKQRLNREKDQADIAKIQAHLDGEEA